MTYGNKDRFGYGTQGGPKVRFEDTIKNKHGLPRPLMYPNWYDENKEFIGLPETPTTGTGIEKNIVGMPEAWQYAPTGNVLDTDNIDFNNIEQVKAIQSAIGATPDGQWGPETRRLYREAINKRRGNLGLDEYTYDDTQQSTTTTPPASNLQIITDPDQLNSQFYNKN